MIRNYEGKHDGYILHTASGDGWETNLSILEALYNDILSAELDPKNIDLSDWITGPVYATLHEEVVAEWNSRQGWEKA